MLQRVELNYINGYDNGTKNKTAGLSSNGLFLYAPTQLVAPRAVTMAVATDAMICTINFSVSFFVMVH